MSVVIPGLVRSAMAAAVMPIQRYPWAARNTIWSSQASRAQGPAMAEDDGLSLAPVFVVHLRAVLVVIVMGRSP